jgi:hypothetical protein
LSMHIKGEGSLFLSNKESNGFNRRLRQILAIVKRTDRRTFRQDLNNDSNLSKKCDCTELSLYNIDAETRTLFLSSEREPNSRNNVTTKLYILSWCTINLAYSNQTVQLKYSI